MGCESAAQGQKGDRRTSLTRVQGFLRTGKSDSLASTGREELARGMREQGGVDWAVRGANQWDKEDVLSQKKKPYKKGLLN